MAEAGVVHHRFEEEAAEVVVVAEVVEAARCYFVEVQVGAMQAEGQVCQAVGVEVQLADRREAEAVAEEAVVQVVQLK